MLPAKKDPEKGSASIDKEDVLWAILTCAAALLVAGLLGLSNFTNDFWCHLSWMRITNRLPLDQWYDDNRYTHLDYPVLAGYIHYYMGAIYAYYDPVGFATQETAGIGQETPELKLGVRMAILALNIFTYFPTAAAVVLLLFKGYSRIFKMSTLFFILVFPMYAYIEFSSTQANAPHLAFLLLCVYFLATDQLKRATLCFTLSLSYKHVVGPLVFPVAIFIAAREWMLQRRKSQGLAKSIFLYLGNLLAHAVVGVLTLAGVCLPLFLEPPAFQNMLGVITHFSDRSFIHPTPSFWNVFKDFVGRGRIDDFLNPFINYMLVIPGAVTLVGMPFVFKKPTQKMFAAYFTVVALTMYHFGFSMHEKHVHYACLTILLYPQMYRGFLVYFFSLTAAALLPTVCYRHSDTSLWIYGTFFLAFSIYYDCWALPREILITPKQRSEQNWFERHSGRLTLAAVSSVFCLLVGYIIGSTMNKFYVCDFFSMYEDVLHKVLFFWHFVFYIYAWTVMFKVYREEEEVPTKEVEPVTPGSPQK